MRWNVVFVLVVAICVTSEPAGASNFYTTQFPLSENPISEGGHWLNGKSVGIDWQNFKSTPGFATFTQPNPSAYDDTTAILSGTWGPDQYVRTVVKIPTPDAVYAQEIEIRLRSTLTAHSNRGYEVLGGSQIVAWEGPLGSFRMLSDTGPYGNLHDGDIFEANIVGNVISVYINGVLVNRAVDNTFTGGSPGIGLFTRNPAPPPFGFSSFTASDSPLGSGIVPRPPTNLLVE